MKIGCCFGYKNHDAILLGKKAGFEFIEVAVTSFASATEEDVADFARFLHENGVECPGANCLFTDDIRLTGENADFGAADAYLNRMLEKLRPIGLKHGVVGRNHHRVAQHAALVALDARHLPRLVLRREVHVHDADAALPRHGNRQA